MFRDVPDGHVAGAVVFVAVLHWLVVVSNVPETQVGVDVQRSSVPSSVVPEGQLAALIYWHIFTVELYVPKEQVGALPHVSAQPISIGPHTKYCGPTPLEHRTVVVQYPP